MTKKEDSMETLPDIVDPVEFEGDPIKVLDTLKDAILSREVDHVRATQALKQVMHKYETKSRVFMIAAAQAELPRIVRLMSFLSTCEEEMFKEERLRSSSTRELTRMYALAQSTLITSIDNVKKVADMRLELMRAGKGDALFDTDSDEFKEMAGLPGLDATKRDRVRRVIGGLMDSIDKDTSVSEYEDDEPSLDDRDD